jgi:hypothetical protein
MEAVVNAKSTVTSVLTQAVAQTVPQDTSSTPILLLVSAVLTTVKPVIMLQYVQSVTPISLSSMELVQQLVQVCPPPVLMY